MSFITKWYSLIVSLVQLDVFYSHEQFNIEPTKLLWVSSSQEKKFLLNISFYEE